MMTLAVPEELVGLLLSDPSLLDKELRELLCDLLGAVLLWTLVKPPAHVVKAVA